MSVFLQKVLKFCVETTFGAEFSFIKQLLPGRILLQFLVPYSIPKNILIIPKSYTAKVSIMWLAQQLQGSWHLQAECKLKHLEFFVLTFISNL